MYILAMGCFMEMTEMPFTSQCKEMVSTTAGLLCSFGPQAGKSRSAGLVTAVGYRAAALRGGG